MNILWLTIPASLLLAGAFVAAFVLAVRGGQYDDLVTPAHRMLIDDEPPGESEPEPREGDHGT